MSYTESDEYQQEIADQYQQRTAQFEPQEVLIIMGQLGFKIKVSDLTLAECGNMNATFLTPDYVVKISDQPEQSYFANTVVSQQLTKAPVVRVLAYDCRDKTRYEVLVMERAPGELWQRTIISQNQSTVESLFRQILQVVNQSSAIKSTAFGSVAQGGHPTYSALLKTQLDEYVQTIRTKKLAHEDDIAHIEKYVHQHLPIFEPETPVLVHQDLHMGNVLHVGDTLTAVIDWDCAEFLPKFRELVALVGLIDNPSQFVEGTPDYLLFKDRRFSYLLPILKNEMPDMFADKTLVLKLNVVGVVVALMWISQNWSTQWNKEMILNLVNNETPKNLKHLETTYYGKVLG